MLPAGVRTELRRFHYDIALRAHPTGLSSALQLVGVSHLLFGTDAPLRTSVATVHGLLDYGFSAQDLRAIDCDNAKTSAAALPGARMTIAGSSMVRLVRFLLRQSSGH